MSESLEHLFVKRFLHDVNPHIPDELVNFQDDPKPELITETLLSSLDGLYNEYTKYRDGARQEKIGHTAQFWISYMDLMRFQNLAQSSIQENNFGMMFQGWKAFIPYYFALNKVNYARYVYIQFSTLIKPS